MKKENKRQAQARRAQERQKQEKKNRANEILQNWGPVVLIAVVVIVLLIAIITSGGSGEGIVEDDSELGFDLVDENGNPLEISDWTEIGETDLEGLNTTEGTVVSEGDTVNIDYIGYHNDVAFEGGEAYGEELTLGSGGYVDGFEEGIIGHAVGETFDMPITFPEGYGGDLSGEDVVFTVTINGIRE